MITAIAVDDEPEAINVIKMLASKLQDLSLAACFNKPIDAIEYLRNNPVDLLFLDINMPEISGLEMLQQIKSVPLVVFTTAYEQYAVASYKFEAVDYLLKPIDYDSFQNAVNRVKKHLANRADSNVPDPYIFIKDGVKTVKVFFNDISVLKACGNYVEFIIDNHKVISRTTISQLLNKLPNRMFVRVHNSYIVNIEKIEKIEHNHVFLDNCKVSIGEGYRRDFFERVKNNTL